MGRLVKTHSTYIEGLINILDLLTTDKSIKTITPGIIKRVKGKSEKLKLKITRVVEGGYKVNARKGKSVQEVFILTTYNRSELTKKLNTLN